MIGGDVLLAYLLATTVVLLVPGPTVMLVVSYGLSEGRRVVWGTVPGVVLGDFTAMTLSFLGLGALLSTSAGLFAILKWMGAAYLIYLGVKMWCAEPVVPTVTADQGPEPGRPSNWSMFGQAYAVTALNPKSMIFFIAFLPQFIDPGLPALPQMMLFGGIFLVLACLNAAAYGLLAGTMRSLVRRRSVVQAVNRAGGSLLIGAGLLTAALRRPG